ncbi:MAG: glutathione synthase [Piptocephalis tieghemiana]|nr:MAG: glutathione synthase [Piptocephalis tieghemiana]
MSSFLPQGALPSNQEKEDLRVQGIQWALGNGLVVFPRSTLGSLGDGTTVVHAPFSLLPTPFPQSCFEEALALQPMINVLIDRVAQDDAYISKVMESVIKVDPFTARLYKLYKDTHELAQVRKVSVGLGVLRSDYLLHQEPNDGSSISIRQVEVNTIAASFAVLSEKITLLHRFLDGYRGDIKGEKTQPKIVSSLPDNNSAHNIARSLYQAYKASFESDRSGYMLMVVQPGERNIFDQRGIEHALLQCSMEKGESVIKTIRCSLRELGEEATLQPETNHLLFRGHKIHLVYYRSGYSPDDYTEEGSENLAWEGREKVELSTAIACPSATYHLIGAKKIQQELSRPGILERFIPKANEVKRVRESFAGLYPLDETPEGESAVRMALKDPEGFVMKPQREGGGNNIYGDDIPKVLKELSIKERCAYILMDLIKPPRVQGFMVRDGTVHEGEVVSELGIYGAIIRMHHSGEILVNDTAGHLLRTKGAETREGGVAVGFAVMDSPRLY